VSLSPARLPRATSPRYSATNLVALGKNLTSEWRVLMRKLVRHLIVLTPLALSLFIADAFGGSADQRFGALDKHAFATTTFMMQSDNHQYISSSMLKLVQQSDWSPVGSWVVRHGIIRISFTFAPDGRFRWQRSPGASSGLDEIIGTYEINGDTLTTYNPDGSQENYRWEITQEYGRLSLYLADSFGERAVYYESPWPRS
jgi:hypothetical protein